MILINSYLTNFYEFCIKPVSQNEDMRRREFIFNILMFSIILLVFAGFIMSVINEITQGNNYAGMPSMIPFIGLMILLSIYISNRYHPRSINSYILILIFILLATTGLLAFGYVLPAGVLIYMLAIVMASVLISVKASAYITILTTAILACIAYLQSNGIVKPDTSDFHNPLDSANLVVFIILFGTVLLVSSLSNIEIERSLRRARQSEKALLKERNLLEIKVKRRTKALEKAQVEKTLELYRFAEFGRMSATLLHDIADPLTSISLNLEQLEARKQSGVIKQVRQGIDHMEEYVYSARQQLKSQTENKPFDSKLEIQRVYGLLMPKARMHKIALRCTLQKGVMLYGDSSRFNQILANLIANSIDAYNSVNRPLKSIEIRSQSNNEDQLLITVKDFGIGITNTELERIFEPFYTTKANDRGTGIGLTIIKRIIEEDFNGKITVDSSTKAGTQFAVTLPIHRP